MTKIEIISDMPPSTKSSGGEEENPFTFTIEIIILLAVAIGLFFILIICCCCIVKKRREKTIEVTPSAIREGRVTPSQLLDAGMSPQSVVEVGAATPSQLVEQGLARPHEVRNLQKREGNEGFRQAQYEPPRVAAPEELLQAGYTPSQLSTYSIIHRNKEKEKGKKKTAIVGSDETLKKESQSKSPKRVVIEPSQGTIYTGPIKRRVKDDQKTEVENYNAEEKGGKKDETIFNNNDTFSTWMGSPKASKKAPEPSTVPSNYKQTDKGKGRVVVVESNVSRKGSMATDVNVLKGSNVSNVKSQSPSTKTHGKSKVKAPISKTTSKKSAAKSASPANKKGSSKYDVED